MTSLILELIKLIFIIIILSFSLICIIILHEIGHILVYKIYNVDTLAIVFYNILIEKKYGVYRISKVRSNGCYVLPVIDSERNWKNIIKMSLLGGPIVNIFLLVIFILRLIYNQDIFIRYILVFNIIFNVNILFGCFKIQNDKIGDLALYFKCMGNLEILNKYILDYIVLNGVSALGEKYIEKIDFEKLNDDEKEDFVFDVVCLVLSNNICSSKYPFIDSYIEYYLYNNLDSESELVGVVFYLYRCKKNNCKVRPEILQYQLKNRHVFEILVYESIVSNVLREHRRNEENFGSEKSE